MADDLFGRMHAGLSDRRRFVNLVGFLVCAAMLAIAYYLQFRQGLEPCPLCIFQRVAFLALGAVFLIAGLHAPRGGGARVYSVALLAVAAAGSALAARHIWIQSLPADQVPACGPGLSYMLDAFPPWETIRMVLEGSGECAEVDRFLGISIPVWSLAGFIVLGIAGGVVNWTRQRAHPAGS